MSDASTRSSNEFVTRQRHPLILKEEVAGKGRGVFAGTSFKQGQEVLEFLGDLRDVSTFADLTHALQVGPRTFLSPSGDVDDFVNHSCQPNCGIRLDDQGRVVLFAMREIARNEEISFDYSTTQTGGLWSMDCQCGSVKCRHHIGDFSDLPSETQAYYIKAGAVLPFLLAE